MSIRHTVLFCSLVMLGGCASMAPDASKQPAPAATAATPAQPAMSSTTSSPAIPASTSSSKAMQKSASADKAMPPSSKSLPAQATSSMATKPQTTQAPSKPEPMAKPAPEPKPVAKPKPKVPTHKKATKPSHVAAAPKPKMQHVGNVLSGQVKLRTAGGQKLGAADYAHTLVYFVPASGASRPKPEHFTIYTHHRDFDPEWLAVPQGSTVTFTNLDEVKHNVFSVTPGSAFDLGYQSANQSVAHTFSHPGMVLLSCHVHRYMKGGVLVVPSRYATTLAADGSFSLSHLPSTSGRLYFRNPRSAPASRPVNQASHHIRQTLVISKPPVKAKIGVGSR